MEHEPNALRATQVNRPASLGVACLMTKIAKPRLGSNDMSISSDELGSSSFPSLYHLMVGFGLPLVFFKKIFCLKQSKQS